MAKSRSKKKKGSLISLHWLRDERVPKITGLALIVAGLYISIAFFSYLFTWKVDQDQVLQFSWDLMMQDVSMANWLGRFGAILSNLFFYWGIGITSFIIAYDVLRIGYGLIRGHSVFQYRELLRNSFVLVLFFSVFLEFVFYSSPFPWGGAFGESLNAWMTNFIGTAGMFILFLSLVGGFVMWKFNPDLSQVSLGRQAMATYTFARKTLGLDQRKKTAGNRPRPEPTPEKAKAASPDTSYVRPVETVPALPEPVAEPFPAAIREELELPPHAVTPRQGSLSFAGQELEIREPSLEHMEDTLNVEVEPGSEAVDAEDFEAYDPSLDLSRYNFPPLELLYDYEDQKVETDRAELESNKDQIVATLLHYKIEISKILATIGPTVTLYEIIPAPGVRISRIKNLEDDIALSLSALGIRIIAPIPGKGTIGIEVPNKKKQIVSLKELLRSERFLQSKMELPIALGKTIANEVYIADLAKMPHLLIAGATGQGKSVGINTLLISLLYKQHPSQVKLVLIDPKKVELFPYSKLENHFLGFLPGADEPITTDTTKVIHTLNSLCIEMEERYDLMKKAHTRNIKEYNAKFVNRRLNPEKGHKFLPYIILVIDEFADLIMTAGKEIELPIARLAQLARAVGIHLVIATQRPSVNIITGVIKANFPARIAYKVASKVDSRTILDTGGAEQLIGRGDMLLSVGGDVIRLQSAFVDTPEVEKVIHFISEQAGYPTPFLLPEYHGSDEDGIGKGPLRFNDLDEMFEDAARLVIQNRHGSTSMIQRRLKLGYNRAGRIMDQLEAMGIVGAADGSKPREVIVFDESELTRILDDLRALR